MLFEEEASDHAFAVGLYREHLEEAAFLYEQRRDDLLHDPELAWTDLADFEERLEAHLDALVLGDDLALAVGQQQREEGDVGALYALVCVLCRHRRRPLFEELLDTLDGDEAEHVEAVCDALVHELPPAWGRLVAAELAHEMPWRQHVALHVAGHRRLDVGEALQARLHTVPPAVRVPLVWALGRLGREAVRRDLYHTSLRHEDPAVRTATALTLLRLGEPAALQHVLTQDRTLPEALPLVGLAGTPREQPALLDAAARGPVPEAALLALGLLGDPGAIEPLLHHLAQADHAEAAALALHVLTGAPLFEEVFVEDEVDEDELFEDEIAQLARGEPLLRSDGTPYGTTVTRLAQDPDAWRTWWTDHAGTFQRGMRYRLGQPCTPTTLVASLRAPTLPGPVRQLIYEEVVIRYNVDAPFDTTYRVAQQHRALTTLHQKADAAESQHRPGRWYFAGHLQAG
ncbi:MAG: HEAT repeat domain-containing protein [Bacteroidota bacterium]